MMIEAGMRAAPLAVAVKEQDDDGATLEPMLRAACERAQPERLRDALQVALGGGGSRMRPRFCLAIARAISEREPNVLAWSTAAAIEMMHCASLVHDDLPCFDDATERRGRPALHRSHGEPLALLAGDALIIGAFEMLASADAPASFIATLARATGASGGLVSGQAFELDGRDIDVAKYHAAKTGALFEAAAILGAESAGGPRDAYLALGRKVGAFYQLVDDCADVFGNPAMLGKPVGRDECLERPSAVRGAERTTAEAMLKRSAEAIRDAVPDHGHSRGVASLRAFLDAMIGRLLHRLD